MCAADPGAFRLQDGQILASARPDLDPHAQTQWNRRAPDEWDGYNVRVAWREADDRGWIGHGHYVRVHQESGMLLIAKWGFLSTAMPASWNVRQSVNHGSATENGRGNL